MSVSEYEYANESDTDLCFVAKSPEIDSPRESLDRVYMTRPREGAVTPTPGSGPALSPRLPLSRTSSFNEEYMRTEERRFQEAAEKVEYKWVSVVSL